MRTDKIITINLVGKDNKPVTDLNGKNAKIHLLEDECDALISIAKSKHGDGLSDREYLEIAANEALRKIIKSEKEKQNSTGN